MDNNNRAAKEIGESSLLLEELSHVISITNKVATQVKQFGGQTTQLVTK